MTNRVNRDASVSKTSGLRRRPFGTVTLGIGLVALIALSGVAAACGGGGGHGGNGLTTTCSSRGPVDALNIPLAAPSTTAPAGSVLTAGYQVAIVNYTSADWGSMIHFPSVYIKIPLNSTAKYEFYFAPTNVTLTSAGWSNLTAKNTTLASIATFAGGAASAATTTSIAVMAKDWVGNLTIEVRWGWTLNVSGTLSSLWSVPSATATSPTLPSIFVAAPYVGLGATTNTTAAVSGSTFEAVITGAVGRTSFGVSVEYPNGTEVVCKEQSNPRPGHCLVVDVPLTYVNGTGLAAGKYIVHIHDSIGAIVHTVSITVVNATWNGWGHHGQGQQLSCSCQGGGNGGGHGGWGGSWIPRLDLKAFAQPNRWT
jgi:hypothetical protein